MLWAAAAAAIVILTSTANPSHAQEQSPKLSTDWVPFSALLKITRPDGSESAGRFYRDQHGCERQETPTGPGGIMIVTIKNFEQEKFYSLMRDQWSFQPMRVGPAGTGPRGRGGQLTRLPETREGFEVYEQRVPSRRPDGATTMVRYVLAPQLNYYAMEHEMPIGVQTAHSIKLGHPDPALFVPPAGVHITEQPGYGGFMTFAAVELRIAFPANPPVSVHTTEETPYTFQTPSGQTLSLVVGATDRTQSRVVIRIMRNASGRAGRIQGEVLEVLETPIGTPAPTIRLQENFELTVIRVGRNIAR